MFNLTKRNLVHVIAVLAVAALLIAGCSQASEGGIASSLESQSLSAKAATSVENPRSISVSGSGSASAAPDMATIQLGVQSRSASASTAAQDNTAKMNNVIAAIKGLGIEDKDIQTVDYRIYLENKYDANGRPTGEREYVVSNQVRVIVRDLDLVGSLLEQAVTADVNTVGGITFGIEDPSALEREAREKAIANAKDRAQQLAAGLGITVGAPLQVSEYTSGSPVARPTMAMEKAAYDMAAAPAIEGGELEITVNVSVSFGIE